MGELASVERKCKAHDQSYYSFLNPFSSPNLRREMDRIERMKRVLDHRIDLATSTAEIELQINKFHERTHGQYRPSPKKQSNEGVLDFQELQDREEWVFIKK